MMKLISPTNHLIVRDWKENIISLVQFPRTHTIPSTSPFALKLETWIRMNGLDYYNVNNEFTKGSSKSQIPFIELNGRQFSDSNFIIEHLINTFKLDIDRNLTTHELAEARALSVLIEESLFRCMTYDRSQNCEWIFTDKGYLPHFTGLKKIIFQKLGPKHLQSSFKHALMGQGYGRHTQLEIEEIFKKDVGALSTFLENKNYLFGDKPVTVDATLFGHLAQFMDAPLQNDSFMKFIEQNAQNLMEYYQRIKSEYWPDWDKIIQQLALNKEDIKEEAKEATTAPLSTETNPPAET